MDSNMRAEGWERMDRMGDEVEEVDLEVYRIETSDEVMHLRLVPITYPTVKILTLTLMPLPTICHL